MDVEGVPPGMTGTPIEGVPPGMTGTPIGGGDGGVQGVPPGMTATPIQGVPPGMTATPINGAATPPAPPQTFRERLNAGLSDLWDGKDVDPMSNMAIGFLKQSMGGVGGLLKLVNDHFAKSGDMSDVMDYLKAHPNASPEEAGDAVKSGFRGATSTQAHAKQAARADWLLRNSDAKGFFQGAGGLGENMAEISGLLAAGAPEVAGLPASEIAGEVAKTWKTLEGSGLGSRLARAGWAAMKSAGEQYAQTYLHTGGDADQAGTSALIAAPLGAAGQGVGEAYDFLGKAAKEVAPVERELEGAPFTQLASEFKDSSGSPSAPERAQQFRIEDNPQLLHDRTEAFKQMQTNLAKRGVVQAIQDTNEAVAGAGVGENIAPTMEQANWRYIPPDGSTSLEAPEARKAMDAIKEQWLGKETTPDEDTKFSQAYDDIRNQLARNDTYQASQPFQLHDAQALARGVETWRDAGNTMDTLAQAKMKQAGLSQEFQKLVQARDDARTAYIKSLDSPDYNDRIAAQQTAREARKNILAFVRDKGTQPDANKVIIQRAEEEQKIANAFHDLHDTIEGHYSMSEQAEKEIAEGGYTRPQTIRRTGSLADDIEQIRQAHGDVLNPLIGDKALSHTIELGDLLKTQPGADKSEGLFESLLTHMRRQAHLGPVRMALSMGSPYAAVTYMLSHSLAGAGGALAVGAAHGQYLRFLRKVATNPEASSAFLDAVKSAKPVTELGPKLARIFGVAGSAAGRDELPAPTLQPGGASAQ
jgi:hypothetical protein